MAMGWSPRKNMAMNQGFGDPMSGGDFGVTSSLGGKTSVEHMDRNHMPTPMSDSNRAARPPIANSGKMHNQANPDHGPHCCTK